MSGDDCIPTPPVDRLSMRFGGIVAYNDMSLTQSGARSPVIGPERRRARPGVTTASTVLQTDGGLHAG